MCVGNYYISFLLYVRLYYHGFSFQAMSIYSTVTAHNTQAKNMPQIDEYEEPLVKVNSITDKGSPLAGANIANFDDSLAEYFSDDEEREKALRSHKEKKDYHTQQLNKLEKDT